jgi:hypothetical protein
MNSLLFSSNMFRDPLFTEENKRIRQFMIRSIKNRLTSCIENSINFRNGEKEDVLEILEHESWYDKKVKPGEQISLGDNISLLEKLIDLALEPSIGNARTIKRTTCRGLLLIENAQHLQERTGEWDIDLVEGYLKQVNLLAWNTFATIHITPIDSERTETQSNSWNIEFEIL